MKKNLLVVSLIMMVCVLFTACSAGREKADEGMKNLSVAMLHLDKDVLSKYGEADDLEGDFLKGFVPSFQQSSGNLFTKDQATDIGKAMVKKLATVEVKSAAIVSEKEDEAEVKITVDKLDGSVLEAEPNADENKKLQTAIGSKEALQKALTDIFVARITNAPKAGTAELTVKCKYDKEKKVWQPNDMDSYVEELYTKAWGMN